MNDDGSGRGHCTPVVAFLLHSQSVNVFYTVVNFIFYL